MGRREFTKIKYDMIQYIIMSEKQIKNLGCETEEELLLEFAPEYEWIPPQKTIVEEIKEKIPTDYIKTEEMNGDMGRVLILHQCGEDKEELINQLQLFIESLHSR
jgi:hypothetical protein